MTQRRIPGLAGDLAEPQSLAQRPAEMPPNQLGSQKIAPPQEQFLVQIQSLNRCPTWPENAVLKLVENAESAFAAATQKAQNAATAQKNVAILRAQFAELLRALNPPTTIFDSAEFKALKAMLEPKEALDESGFLKKTALRGQVQTDIQNRQIAEAVDEADRLATKQRLARAKLAGVDEKSLTQVGLTLKQLARQIKKRLKLGRPEVTNLAPDPNSVAEEFATANELSLRALETMQLLREELAPRWVPAKQPWFIQAADNEVYAIVLACVPKDLFAATQSFEAIKALRSTGESFGSKNR